MLFTRLAPWSALREPWSGTSKRATPAAFVVTVTAIAFSPFPGAFQTARVNVVSAGRPPTLYVGVSGDDAFS